MSESRAGSVWMGRRLPPQGGPCHVDARGCVAANAHLRGRVFGSGRAPRPPLLTIASPHCPSERLACQHCPCSLPVRCR
eukprot:scaffold2261_cov405-Prasinococcus_capsulatus_cf.AAC.12